MSNVEVGQFQNFVELLQYRAKHQAGDIAFRFLPDGDITPLAPTLTFKSLDQKAKVIAQKLLTVCDRGDRALLIYPSGLDFITAFFGCLYAGVIAVPAYPPKRNQKLQRLQILIEDCDASIVLTDSQSYEIAVPQFSAISALEHLPWLRTDEGLDDASADFCVIEPEKDEIAFLQYTSGSTGDPKGVMVSQSNLIINSELIYTATSHNDDDVIVGWMPLFHDMGLIGNVLQPVFAGVTCTFMQPTAFLRKPLRWLKAISEYRGTSSGGPNFAYDICVSTVKDEDLEHLDLSSWKVAFNGAEPIRISSMRAFSEKFASCGFKDEAHYPCYGMAETVLHMTSNEVSRAEYSEFFDAELLLQNTIEKMDRSDPGAIELVNCGRAWCDHLVKIVDPKTFNACEETQIGEIWVQGETITKGYWKKPEVTEAVFNAYISDSKEGPFLRTGDLGFLLNGELFVTGRLKDVLIIRGLNHYPQDIELTAFECHEALMPNGAAAFSVQEGGDEQLVLVLEVKRTFLRKFDENDVAMSVQKSIAEHHDLQANSILFIKPGRLSKTSSGKVQRQRSKQLFLDDDIEVIARVDKRDQIDESELPEFPVGLWKQASLSESDSQKKIIISNYLQRLFTVFAGLKGKEFPLDKEFLAYGLDSLSLSRIAAKVAEDLSIDIPIEVLFLCETIELLSDKLLILSQTENQSRQPIEAIYQEDKRYPLSHAQERMWFLSQFEQSTLYNISGLFELSGDVDGSTLAKAFQKIIARHESLRTRFVESNGQIVQLVDTDVDWQLSILDLSDRDASELAAAIESEMQFVFDLSKDVLFRATLYKKSDGEYTLAVSMHHIIADGWSVAVLMQELSSIYTALVEQREIPLDPITIHYKDYSAWQQNYLAENLFQKQSEYWLEQLKDCQPLDLLTDKSRPSSPDYAGDHVSFCIDEKLCRKLKNLSQTQGATLYMTLLTAFNILLAKYSGQNDICVGSPIAGRTRSEANNLIGLFVNTLVMRTDVAEEFTFVELLNNVKTTTINAYANQDIPFEKVVELVQPDRDAAITPLFQTMFVLQDGQSTSVVFPGLDVSDIQQHSQTSKFDITLELVSSKDTIKGVFEFKTSLYTRSTIEQIKRHFLNTLSAIVAAPELCVNSLLLLDDEDVQQQNKLAHGLEIDFSNANGLHDLFSEQCKKTPNALAAILDCGDNSEGISLSYQELDEKSNQLAHLLQSKGVANNSLVALCVERSIEMLVGMLGILKAGAAYVPLDPSYPQDRLQYMLDNSQATVMITQSQLPSDLVLVGSEDRDLTQINLDLSWATIADFPRHAPQLSVCGDDLAYVIYTSGSTGKPKGVAISHRSICNQICWVHDQFPQVESDNFLFKSSLSFDASVWEIWVPLLSDATLIMAKPDGHQDIQYLLDTIVRREITQVLLLPSMFQTMMGLPNLKNVNSLKRIFMGAEALPTELVATAFEYADQVINVYGPTECTIIATFFELSRSAYSKGIRDKGLSGYAPIGKAVTNLCSYVLDKNCALLPMGVAGELHIGGAGVGQGYVHQPELTSERFIANPFSDNFDGSNSSDSVANKLYKTGDLVRLLPDGNIEFLGRIDHQVKIRGFRIELGEIESVLLDNEDISESVVIAKEDQQGNARLVAYYVAKNGEVDTQQLQKSLMDTLPEYMVPAFFMALEAFPKGQSGKIDRKLLPDPDYREDVVYIAPATETEKVLAGIWSEILGVDKVGRSSNFFSLGGQSLLAVRVMLRIQNELLTHLPLRRFFAAKTLTDLAAAIDEQKQLNDSGSTDASIIDNCIREVATGEKTPLSYSQQRLWVVDQLGESSSQYNMPAAIRIAGQVDVLALENAFSRIITRHEILRTTYSQENGQPVQEVLEDWDFSLEKIALNDGNGTSTEDLVKQEALKPFDLSRDLSIRASVISLAEDESLLLVTLHHIASDGWSTSILIRELNVLYSAYVTGSDAELAELPCQYNDYAVWQRNNITEETFAHQIAAWKNDLKGLPSVHNLPLDRNRPAVPSYDGDTLKQVLSSELSQSLSLLAKENDASLFMLLNAALASLISRYSGQHDVVIGTPIANRSPVEVESLIGFFVNTAVLRSDLSEALSFKQLLAQSKEKCLFALENSQIPFEMLVDAVQPQRSTRYNPLFQIMLAMQNNESTEIQLHDSLTAHLDESLFKTKFDITLNACETDEGISLSWEFATDLFDRSTIEKMSAAFQILLTGISKNPDTLVGALPLLSEEEHDLIVNQLKPAETEATSDQCLHQLFESKATSSPDAIAAILDQEIDDDDKTVIHSDAATITYRELNERANQLAHCLRNSGVENNTPIALCVDRSIEMLVGMLGILKAGAAYVPLDPSYPLDRLRYMLDHCRAPVLITQAHLQSIFSGGETREENVTTICLDENFSSIADYPLAAPEVPISSRDLAYVIYTSGSTGRPKGVAISHAAICNQMNWVFDQFPFDSSDTFLHKTPFSFDASVWEIWAPLLSDATLLMAKTGGHQDIQYLLDTIVRRQVTQIQLVPSLLNAITTLPEVKNIQCLKRIFLGGEALTVDLANAGLDIAEQVVNLYGPTECTINATFFELARVNQNENDQALGLSGYVPIGRPVNNLSAYVLDENHNVVPVGVAGELYLGGAGVGSGYLHQPELSDERFIPDRLTNKLDAKLYKTGDRVRTLSDGNLEFLGRIDHQVKIRGFRVELGEIDVLLSQQEDIRESIVVAVEDSLGNQQIVAYFVAHDDEKTQSSTIADIKDKLADDLPDYMIPAYFIRLDELPVMPNGKVDRKALPDPEISIIPVQYVAPRNELEKTLAGIFETVLKAENVGVKHDFFEIGGQSLLAIQVISRIKETLHIPLKVTDLFSHTTIEKLAIKVSSLDGYLDVNSKIQPASKDIALPLSFSQQRLWVVDQLAEGDSAQYNMLGALRLEGTLNSSVLEQALHTVIERHSSLRTVFIDGSDGPVQVVQSSWSFSLPQTDVSDMTDDNQSVAMQKAMQEEVQQPFDLSQDLMLRAKLLKLSDNDHLLLITVHHIASDGWSTGILINEMSALYAAYLQGNDNPLPLLEIQYSDYAVWQREWLQGQVLEEQLSYWKTQLVDLPLVHGLPLDKARPKLQSFNGGMLRCQWDQKLLTRLKSLCVAQGATLFMGLHAAFSTLLARYSGETDIVIGSPVANREQTEVADLIGFFVNTLVLRSDLSESPSFIELLQQCRQTAIEAYAHQQMPFEQIVEALQPERNLSHSPLFQVMLVLQNNEEGILALPGLKTDFIKQEEVQAKFDLTLHMSESENTLGLEWEYNSDIFAADTIARLADHFTLLVESLVSNPESNVYSAQLLSESERHQQLMELNDAAEESPVEDCIHELFEQQAKNRPDTIAVEFNDQKLTYAQLNSKANQLAHYLVDEKNIRPDTLVGVCFERSIEMIVGVLAVLKAGAAYVPLDPDYPESRLDHMLTDGNLNTVITHSSLLDQTPISQAQALCLDDKKLLCVLDGLSIENIEPASIGLTPQHLAYVIYTSGSTGTPKGVLQEHDTIVNLVQSQFDFDREEISAVLQYPSISFDVSIQEIATTWHAGATLVITPYHDKFNPLTTLQHINDSKVSHIFMPPVAIVELAQAYESSQIALPSLKAIISAGEQLKINASLETFIADNNIQLLNHYGPTETHVVTEAYSPNENMEISIGKPVKNTRLYIVDANNGLLPLGVPGELLVAGVGLARGYFNRQDLSDEKFVRNPFSENPNDRVYKTGDLVRWLPDGNLEFMGRIDHQVKIRGFRVELGEIEHTLLNCESVKETVVLAREDTEGDVRLVAYLVVDKETYCVDDLRTALAESLPNYMVPSFFVVLDEFPLTPNGKVNRKALPKPDVSAQSTVEYVAPRNEVERKLVDIWSDVLHFDEISIKHNFFEIGGQSLFAIQVVSRIREAFSVQLKVNDLFLYPTIEQLVKIIDSAESIADVQQYPKVEPRDIKGLPPLSLEQQAYWFLYQLEGGSATYNTPAVMRLTGDVNKEALARSFKTIIERHESLRTLFVVEDGIASQKVIAANECEFNLEFLTLDTFKDSNALENHIRADFGYVFDLENELPIRVRLLQINSQEYVLTLLMHHIIADGWSADILMNEFEQIYTAYNVGQENPLPTLPIQYGDYAVWQKNHLKGEAHEQEVDYWRSKLKGLAPLLSLPTDYPRPPVQSYRGHEVLFSFPLGLTETLNTYAIKHGTTLFNTLLSGLNVVLASYSRSTDIPVGTAVANRTQKELESLIGCFVNTLVIRSTVDTNQSFNTLVEHVSEQALEALDHASIPFDNVVEAVQPERSLGIPPIFQVMFRLHNYRAKDAISLQNVTAEKIHIPVDSAKLDLNISLTEIDGRIEGSIEYATDLFNEDTIHRIAKHFQTVLESAMADSRIPVKALTMLSQEEMEFVEDWNKTQVAYPQDECMHHLFEKTAERFPNKLAYVCGNDRYTYSELNSRANRLAHFLISRGIGPEVGVGVSVERSAWAGISCLAAFKSGGTYIPLDASYPKERLAHMLDLARPKVILTLSYLAEQYADSDVEVICLDSDWDEIKSQAVSNPIHVGADHSAYILFTSGTTGKPKGILVAHKSFRNMAVSHEKFGLHSTENRVLQFASLSFSIALWGTFMAWAPGGTLYSVTKEEALPGEALYSLLEKEQITHVTWPVSLLSVIPIDRMPVSLQTVISSAEPCTDAVVDRWTKRGCRFLNLYGNSEVSLGSTMYEYHKVGQKLTIGKALPNTQMYLLDEHLQQVPIGVIAEIYTSGVGLAVGYIENPMETAESFIPCPFLGGQNARLYKTGDLGRYLPNGEIQFIGREDFQVSIRGFRVELTEIEDILRGLECIAEVAVVSRDGGQAMARLVCFYVLNEQQEDVETSFLRDSVGKKLPNYMVPSLFMRLDAMPLTPNRKVDRLALPDIDQSAISDDNYLAPRNATEIGVAEIWCKILEIEKIGVHQNFFELGGHSLLATQVISKIRSKFDVEITLQTLFKDPTIEALSLAVQQSESSANEFPIERITDDIDIPLSFAQERLWFLDRYEANSNFYHMPSILGLHGRLDKAALEQSFFEIVRRHEALRTNFMNKDGGAIQKVWPIDEIKWSFDFVDASANPSSALAEFDARIAAELQRNFDLEKDSLLRTLLFKVSDDEHKLFINMHHIVADGWSISVLIKEMRVLYEAFSHQQASPLEELAVQYPDFSVWQKSYLQGDVYQQQASYWSGTLEHLPIITLPLDFDRPENQTYSGDRVYFNLAPSLTKKIHTLSTQQGVTPFMTMLTVFNILLQRYSGQNDICIGTPIANRVKTEIEPLIGFFANTLTLRTDLSGDPSFLDVLSRVKRTTLGAYENQDLPFEKVVDLVLPKRDPSRSPLFQVSFALQKPPSLKDGLSGIRIENIETENKTAKFDLLLELLDTEKGLEGYFEFNTDLFKRETIAAYAEQFSFLVDAVLQRPNVSIANFSLLALPESQAPATLEFSSCDLSTYPVLTKLLASACEVSNQASQYAVLDGDHNAVASGTVGSLYLIAENMGDANESTQATGVRGLVRLTSGETAFNTGFSARLTDQGFALLAAVDRVALVDDTLVYPEIVAQEFMRSAAIDDCYVMFKNIHNENAGKSQTKIIVYLSSQMELDEEALNSQLREAMPACPLPHAYTPVMSLPVLTHGDVNVNELSAIPVVSTGMIEHVEKKVSSLDGVSRVSVSPRYHTPVQKLSHLSDLIPEIKTLGKPALSVSTEKRRSLNESLTLEPAISYGGELTEINDNLTILQDVIVHAANTATHQTVKFYYADGVQSELSYSDILSKARRIKTGLMQSGLQRGQKVIFQFNRNEDFVNAFWGCTLAGLVPVPIAASRDYSKSNANTIKLAHAYRMMDKPVVLTSDDIVDGVKNIGKIEDISSLEVLSVSEFYALPEDDQVVRVDPDDVALILLTSGSTGLPKCVQLSHKNVISRSQGSIQKNGFDQDLVSISWMPMDHVGGIVYFHIRDVYLGAKEVNVDIDYILADPLRWLELIHEHRVNITWAPNFAYSLIVDKEKDLAKRSFDLSCMHFMLNGGEAVVPKTMQVFIELLAPHGLHEDAVKPIYGMSEISSGITYPERLELTYSGDDSVFVSVGKPVPGVNLRIVDEHDNLLNGGQSGRLQVSGLTMTQGYLGGDEINGDVFTEDGWFKTGDIAFIEAGNLTITGREKDMIIINGINFYSHEIESVVDDVDGINVSYTAACAVQRDGNPSDQLAVFFNTDIVENDDLLSLIKNIRRTIVSRIGVHPSFVLPLDKEDIPKTEIGKIQLSKLSKRFGEGQFDNLVKRLDILEGNKDTLPNWFYQNKWIEKSLPVLALNPKQISVSQSDANKDQVLILSNDESNALAEIIARHYHGKVIQFIAADAYEECDSNIYRIDPKAPQDYLRAMESLIAKGIAISSVIHLWEYGNVDGTEFAAAAGLTSTGIDTIYHHGLGSLYSLVKALKESSLDHPKRWLYVSSNAQKVMEDDRVSTEKTLVIPLLITLEKELSGVVAHHIDLAGDKNVAHAEHILRELHTVHHDHEIAYRHGKRWVACLTEATMKLNAESRIQALVYGGAYLITGGLGGIAVELATYLIRQFNAKLLLVGRTAHEALDANKKEQLETLQGMGNVFYDDVDICDMDAIEKSLGLAEKEWQQKLNGIFHLAGLSLDKAIAEENDGDVHAILMPKVVGTNVLYHVVNKRSDTIFVNFSSVNGVFGGSMMGAYSAANRYQMSFVDATRQNKNVRTYTFAWSMWHDMGMGKKYSHMQSISKSMGFAAITVKQGMDSLLVCLSNGLNNVLIGLDGSKANIYTRLVNDKPALQEVLCFVQAPQALEISLGQLALDDQFGTAVEPRFICQESFPLNADNSIDEQAVLLSLAGVTHVQEEKVAPRNEIEEQLIKIATDVFNVTQPIGVKDNFFDVGANSLLIVKFHHEIQEKLAVEFALVELFNATSVEKVANFLSNQQKPEEVASQARSVAEDRKAAMQRRRKGRGGRGRR